MNAEKFWLGWLKTTMIILIVIGGFLTFFSSWINSVFLDVRIDAVFLNELMPGENLGSLKNWYTSILGAVMLGWGFSMLYIIDNPLRQREKWAWRSIFYPVLFWYLLDSGVSAYHGAIFNVIINTVLFLQVMAPLLFLRNILFEPVKATA